MLCLQQHAGRQAATHAPTATAAVPRLPCVRSRHVCRAAHGQVLERAPVEQAAEEAVVEDVHASAFEVESVSASPGLEREFQDYANATEFLTELEHLQAELSSNQSVMDSLWASPSTTTTTAPPPPQPQELFLHEEDEALKQQAANERRAARAASRQARKAKQQARAAAASNSSGSVAEGHGTTQAQGAMGSTAAATETLPQQPAVPAVQPGSAPDLADLSADLESLHAISQQLLEHNAELGSVPQAAWDASSSTTSRQQQPGASTSGPSIVLQPPKAKRSSRSSTAAASSPAPPPSAASSFGPPSLSLPSLMPAPSSAARARQQRRLERYSPRTQASAATAAPTPQAKQSGRSQGTADSTTHFMKEAGTVALLQGNEQKELATVVKDYLLLMRIKHELKSVLKREPVVEEWAKAAKMEVKVFTSRLEAGQAAKSIMVKSNYRLVVNIVSKYRGRGMEMHDLIAEGMHGLLRGVEKFDGERGFRFSTYAHWWIRQSVSRALVSQTRAVRLPYHMQELLMKLRAARTKFQEAHDRQPTDEEMAAQLKVPVSRIASAHKAAIAPKSLDAQLNDDGEGGDLKDHHLADDRLTPEEHFEEEQMQAAVRLVLQELDQREAGIIRMRLGIDGSEMSTLEDIGRTYNVARERVRQVEAKAMHKLQELAGDGSMGVTDYSMAAEKEGMVARSSRGTLKS